MSLDLEAEVRVLFREKMLEFIGWAKENWVVSDPDRTDDAFADKSDDYRKGYNAGVEGMVDAFEVWNEEFGP